MVGIGRHRRGTVALLSGAVLVVALAGCSRDSKDAAPSTTTTTMADAAGKDCVAFADALPEGAPEVPITPGPPPTDLVVEDLVVGTGPAVSAGATVTVDFIGVACSTGKIFDSTYARGTNTTFVLDQTLGGWTEGIVGMQAGGRRLLVIPPGMAGNLETNGVGANETRYFVVELDSFE